MHGFLASSLSLSLSLSLSIYIYYLYKYVCDRREDARVHMAAATVFEAVESVAVKTNINFARVKRKHSYVLRVLLLPGYNNNCVQHFSDACKSKRAKKKYKHISPYRSTTVPPALCGVCFLEALS